VKEDEEMVVEVDRLVVEAQDVGVGDNEVEVGRGFEEGLV
jgi:hypothetical protein